MFVMKNLNKSMQQHTAAATLDSPRRDSLRDPQAPTATHPQRPHWLPKARSPLSWYTSAAPHSADLSLFSHMRIIWWTQARHLGPRWAQKILKWCTHWLIGQKYHPTVNKVLGHQQTRRQKNEVEGWNATAKRLMTVSQRTIHGIDKNPFKPTSYYPHQQSTWTLPM